MRPMSLLPVAKWLAETDVSIALHESQYMYPLIESVHVWTLCLFLGLTALLDLRLIGMTLRRTPASEVIRRFEPWMKGAFVVMVITGVLLVWAIPVRSYQNVFFRAKLIFLVLAGLNVWVFHNGVFRRAAEWDMAPVPPRAAKRAGLTSLVLWSLIVIAGRFIAYNWFDCDHPQAAIIRLAAGCEAQPGETATLNVP